MFRPWLTLRSILVGGLCTTDAYATSTEDLFSQQDVIIEVTQHTTVLPGFILDGAVAELVVITVNESRNRRLQIYQIASNASDEKRWAKVVDVPLRPSVLFVDLALIDGHERLITVEPRQVNWFDPETKTERLLFEVNHDYRMGQTNEIRRVDITHDLNGDGRDDIVIPDVDGFYIAVQSRNPIEGKRNFSEPVLIGPPEPFRNAHSIDDERIYGTTGITEVNLPWYLSRVHKMDFNLDGRTDLVFWNEDHFDVHYQSTTGTFAPDSVSFFTEVPFDSDGSYSLFFSFSGENPFALITGIRKKTRRTVLSSIQDMNSDGVADLVTFTTEGRSIMNHKSWYQVFPGYPAPNGIAFKTKAESTLHLKKSAGVFTASGYASHRIQDINDDGRLDMIVGQVNMGYRKMVRAMMGNSITIDIECYRGVDGGLDFSPDDVRRIRPKIDLFGKRGPYFPAVMLGDISGDGKIDLLTGVSWNRLNVYLGSTGNNLFEQEAKHVQILQPRDEQYISLQHLNRDHKEDLLVYYKATDPTRASILLAK